MTLNEYLAAALTQAQFEAIDDGQKMYAEIPNFRGVWAQGRTREEALKELRQALKGWVELQIERGNELPLVDGAKLEALTFA